MEGPHIQFGELELIASMVRQQLKGAKEAGLVIPEQVYRWLQEAHEIINKIENPNVVADEIANQCLKDMIDRGKNISWVDFPVDTQGIELFGRDDFVNFNSRRNVFEKILDDLKNEEGGIIGIIGIGGMGKTKLVMEIGKKAKHQQLFNEVVMVTVTQNSDTRNIQEKLANALNLRLGAFSEEGRSDEIQTKILTKTNILFILDNVWEKIDTEHIGIPLPSKHNGYRIVITTRSKGVCENMGCISPVCLERIEDEEVHSLFIKQACPHGKQHDLKNIVDKCGGLPLAVVSLGRSLRSKGPEEYKVAALKLSTSNFVNIGSTQREIYACLKLSYDYLDDLEAQKCFLLCSLFPEDNKIEVEGLTRYAYGYGLFEDVESVDQARQKMIACVTKLKDACLLSLVKDCCIGVVDVSTVNYLLHVKMHDVVRDVAISISKLEGLFLVPDSLK